MPQHCSEIANSVWLPGQINKDMPSLRQFHEKDSGQPEGWCCTMMSGEMHLSLNLVRSLFIYLFTRRMMEKIVLRSWDPTSPSLSPQGKPRRKIKPTSGVFVIVRAAWSCSNIAPCFTRALKTLPIPAGPIIWTHHSVMHCSEKRENMRDDHCDCLWLIIKTQGHIGLAGSPASASFYPGERDDSDEGPERMEGENKNKCLGNPGPWHSQPISGFYLCGLLSLPRGCIVTRKRSNELDDILGPGPVGEQWTFTMLTTFFFLKTKEITGTLHLPQSFRCDNLIQQSPLVDCDMWLWDQWIILGLCSAFVIPSVSQLLPPQLSSPPLPRNPSSSELSQPSEKAAMLFILTTATREPTED